MTTRSDKKLFELLFEEIVHYTQQIENARNFVAFLADKRLNTIGSIRITEDQWKTIEKKWRKENDWNSKTLEAFLDEQEDLLFTASDQLAQVMLAAENLLIELENQDEE